MSSILKALEKVEESKSPNRMAGESGLIRSRNSRPTWVMPVAVLCGAGVAALVTFVAMGGFSRHAPVAPAPVAVAKSAPVVVAPINPVIETPAAPPEQAAPAGSAEPVEPAGVSSWNSATVTDPVVVPASKAPSAARKKTAVPLPVTLPAGKSRVVSAVPQRAAVQPVPAQSATVQTAPVPAPVPTAAPAPATPELKVSGIAWQGKGESSFAVVNGRAVLQGGMVDGYKVLEIHQDMVRFSGSNGNIDVPLGGDDK